MTRHSPFAMLASLLMAATTLADDPAARSPEEHTFVKATYLVTGLHCPPCTRTVESSLKQAEGVRSIKVDWKTKLARIEFDEAVLPAQKVSHLIAATPHMMGSGMHYSSRLTLKAPAIRDADTVKRAEETLGKVEGVKRVAADPKQHTLAVEFAAKGELTSQQMIDALKEAGIEAENI